MSKLNRRTLIRGVAVFILLPLLLGVLMYLQMLSVLHTHMEEQVTSEARALGQLALRRLSVRLTEMDLVAGYLENNDLPEDEMGGVTASLLDHPSRVSSGILRLEGNAVSGATLPLSQYPAVRSAFRGSDTVRFRQGEGLLLTAPVFHNGNVRYVLYQFFDPQSLFGGFGATAFNGEAELMLVDGSQRIAIPITAGGLTESDPFFQSDAAQQSIGALSDRLRTDSVAAVYCSGLGGHEEQQFLFVSVLGQTGMYLLGMVPHQAVAGGLSTLSAMTAVMFALLLALLTVGTFRIVSMDARARESDELRRAKQIAEEASESKGRFLSSMSHELRTPINTIMGMNEMILRETGENSTRERSRDIKSASQILLGLINDVLDFSKIESGKLTIIEAEYDLVAMIRDLVLLSENRAMSKSLDFQLKIDPALPVGLWGDDVRIRQVLTNLLTNAVKYTQQGTVTLHMSGARSGTDTLLLHCEVSDTGIGIRPEDIERLRQMDPFTRVDQERNRLVEGSGLGLPIIVNLLHLMGSELKIDSVYNQGSTFSFDLVQHVVDNEPIGDIRKRIDSHAREYEYKVTCYAPKAKVLVVDDNAMNRKIFTALLGPTGIQVTAASGGEKCLELAKDRHFDLIFMDHLMPEMDGVETLNRLRAMEGSPCQHAPVIALTANAFSGAREKYLGLGFDGFLSKPIVTGKLEGLLVEMLPRDRLEPPPPGASAAHPAQGAGDLPEVDGVSWEFALLHVSDHTVLLDAMRDYTRALPGARAEVDRLVRALDTADGLSAYRVRVHSLKSTSAMVGVLSVSELARALENAARGGDRERIQAVHPVLTDAMRQMEERLTPVFGQTEEEKPLQEGAGKLRELLPMLSSALEEMDLTVADALVGQINACRYAPELQEDVDELAKLEAALDFDEAGKLCARLMEKTGAPDGAPAN